MKHIITMSAFFSLALAASAQTNTFVGSGAGAKNKTGESNTAVGANALPNNKTGGFNVAVGDGSLLKNSKGNNNIAIGVDAGAKLTKDDNICIDNVGRAKDSGTIRLGRTGTHKKSYFAGKMFGDGSGLKKVKVKPTDIKGTIPGSKITASSITGLHLADSLALPGTTTGAFSGSFSGDLDGNATTATTATSLSGSLNGSQIANGTVTASKLVSNLSFAGTTSGTFSGNLSGNATTATSATSLSGSLNGGQIVNGTVTAGKLASNLTLAGTTTGTFSGTLTGNAATATSAASLSSSLNGSQLVNGSITSGKLASDLTLAGTTTGSFTGNLNGIVTQSLLNDSVKISITSTGTLLGSDATGYDFDNGSPGLLIETNASGEGAGMFLNGATAVLYSPGDNDILQVHDEDNMGTAVFRVRNSSLGIVSLGSGTFRKGIAHCGVEELRTLRGNIASNGTTLSGSGFTSNKLNTGFYSITFTNEFSDNGVTPVVTCKSLAGPKVATIFGHDETGFTVFTSDLAGNFVDCEFHFIVTAP